ncbi:hypothetical protein Ga0100230_014315 [Opitutaceae bacterium TAV3]|nr:hypothetical protein Ga0100230_014315 [Opitutaceae bacterium TAV3]
MPRPPKITPADITLRLQVSGPQRSSDLATALGVNQSQISRRLAALGSDAILRLGAGPRTRYALRRRVRDLGDSWPVFRIGADGHATEWARLNVLHGGCQLAWSGPPPAWADRLADPEGFGDGLPCFLADLRPQGFLGRLIARRHAAALAVAPDPGQWNDDDTLVYLQAAGDDCPGDLLVGEMPLRRFQERRLQGAVEREAIPDTERGTRYGDLAAATLAGDVPGSSAGGEQPKFVTTLAGDGGFHPVLVKFSPVRDAAANRRWADLLVAEYHALAVLANHGQAAPHARLIESAGRLFLEVRRHDRSGAYGRIGQISLSALHAGLPEASARDWPGSADDLRRAGLIDDATVRDIRCPGDLRRVDRQYRHAFWQPVLFSGRREPRCALRPPMTCCPCSGVRVPKAKSSRVNSRSRRRSRQTVPPVGTRSPRGHWISGAASPPTNASPATSAASPSSQAKRLPASSISSANDRMSCQRRIERTRCSFVCQCPGAYLAVRGGWFPRREGYVSSFSRLRFFQNGSTQR